MWKICTIVCRSNTVKLYLNHWSHMRIWTRKLQYICSTKMGIYGVHVVKLARNSNFFRLFKHMHMVQWGWSKHTITPVESHVTSQTANMFFSTHDALWKTTIYQGKRSGLPYVCWTNLGHWPDCLCMVFLLAIANSYISQKNWTSCADSVCKPIRLIVP